MWRTVRRTYLQEMVLAGTERSLKQIPPLLVPVPMYVRVHLSKYHPIWVVLNSLMVERRVALFGLKFNPLN